MKDLSKKGKVVQKPVQTQNYVERLSLMVDEFDLIAKQLLDCGTRIDAAVADEIEQIRIQCRVMAERRADILGQSVAAVRPLQHPQ
jgi:hypothetical protein